MASALDGSSSAFGILPGGRCNDFAHALGLSKRDGAEKLKQALQLARGQKLYERRLQGVVTGHEFAGKVCDILQIKKREGTYIKIPGGNGGYLKSDKAEKAFPGLELFTRSTVGQDTVFDVKHELPCFYYVDGDILRNDALNANTWFNNAYGTARPIDKKNDYGLNLGGPVRIPSRTASDVPRERRFIVGPERRSRAR